MAKRLRSDPLDGGKRPRHAQTQKHLYVVLDDWEKGYSIHRIDVGRAFQAPHRFRYGPEEPPTFPTRTRHDLGLPDPPLLRLEAASRGGVLVGALGSKILALWQTAAGEQLATHAVAYGTDTGRLHTDPPHPDALRTMRFVFAAGERLYALHEGGLHCLDLGVEDETLPSGAEAEAEEHRWAWTRTRVSAPLRLPRCDGDPEGDNEDEPFEITSYAVHPDGRTIFVSAHATRQGGYAGTFSLDTALGGGGGDAQWTPRGEWLLPFHGQGHYDASLDAWVGLHSPEYLCTCDVPAPLAGERARDGPRQPSWTLVGAVGLFKADPDPKMSESAASLVCMGGGQFCVVESMALAREERVLLRLARFRVERDRNGWLCASSRGGAALSCRVPKFDPMFSPRAFCT